MELTQEQQRWVEELRTEDAEFLTQMFGESFDTDESDKKCLMEADGERYLTKRYQENYDYKALLSCNVECKIINENLEKLNSILHNLTLQYESVAKKTSSLHLACDQLMSDQTGLATAAEQISQRLTYFDKIDQVYQKLQSPLLSVTGESFMQMLALIDESIIFFQNQKDYKESELYAVKAQQCLAKALNRVKQHIYNLISRATENVTSKLGGYDTTVSGDDTFTLFYGLFGSHSPGVRNLMENLERKRDENNDYKSILNDCYNFYLESRERLIGPSIGASVEQLKTAKSGICLLVRSGCSLLLRLCNDEWHLYNKFFTLSTESMHLYFEKLCRIFYDAVRPIVIHAPHFETLAELCSILKYEILDERCNLDPEIYVGFIRVCDELGGDIVERLVYRAQIYSRRDIRDFNASPGDLAYPDKLQMMDAIGKSLSIQAENSALSNHHQLPSRIHQRKMSNSSVMSLNSQEVSSINALSQHVLTAADLHGLWYPTVKRTVLCLSKLFRCLDNAVFQSISEEILSACIDSLNSASEKIATNKDIFNAQLFLIKHLLILREQTAPFRGSYLVQQGSVDLSKIKDSALNLLHQKSRWFSLTSNALLEFLLQSPANVADYIIDSRRVLDLQLKQTCQNFITSCCKELSKDLDEFVEKAQPYMCQDASKSSLKSQPFAGQEILQERVNESYKKLRNNVPTWKALLSIYLSNKETENILFSPIKNNTETAFTKFREIVEKYYSLEEAQVVACPSAEEVTMLLF